jgi:putative cardiolipin synthase
MKKTNFIALMLAVALTACSSLPTSTNVAKTYSTAFDHPEQTQLGRLYLEASRKHHALSGFYILNNGLDGLAERLQLIDQAQAALDLQYYIFRQDRSGRLVTAHLLAAAERGVKIRILVDDGATVDGDEQLLTLAAHPNIQVRVFNPLRYRGHDNLARVMEISTHKSHLDYRMHNKLFVADAAVALVGGRNIGDEYFQIDPQGQFGDDDVVGIGPVVKKLTEKFDLFWNSDHAVPAQNVEPERVTLQNLDVLKTSLTAYRQEVEQNKTLFAAGLEHRAIPGIAAMKWAVAQVVCDSPDKRDVEDDKLAGTLIYEPVVRAAAAAKSEVLIVTPFFVPGEEGLKLFQDLQTRHVAVRALTNSLESTPQLPAHAGYAHYRRSMLKLGVQLYEVRATLGSAKGSGESKNLVHYGTYGLHAKQYIFDRQRIFLGSMNFDQRSMHINTEIGLIIDSPELARQEAERFERLISPADSYRVQLKVDPATQVESLVWSTLEDGKQKDYDTEPSHDHGRKLKEELMTILPLDSEL